MKAENSAVINTIRETLDGLAAEIEGLRERRPQPRRIAEAQFGIAESRVVKRLIDALEEHVPTLGEIGFTNGRGGRGLHPMVFAPDIIRAAVEHGVEFAKEGCARLVCADSARGRRNILAWGFHLAEEMDLGFGIVAQPYPKDLQNERFDEWSALHWAYRGEQQLVSFSVTYDVQPVIVRMADDADPDTMNAGREPEARLLSTVQALSALGAAPVQIERSWTEFDDPYLKPFRVGHGSASLYQVNAKRKIAPTPLQADAVEFVKGLWALQASDRERVLGVLSRLDDAKRQQRPPQAALDTGIAFEMMLTNKGEGGGIGSRMALRAALMLGRSLDDRRALRRAVSDLYSLRSKAAHGSGGQFREEEQFVAARAIEVGCSLICAVVNRGGFPDWTDLELNPPALELMSGGPSAQVDLAVS